MDEAPTAQIEGDKFVAVCQQLYDSKLEPRFQIQVTQSFVDLLANAVIDAKCKNGKRITGNSRDFPYSTKLLLLNELGLLPNRLFKELDVLRKHRNRAAHDPFFEVAGRVSQGGPLHEYCIALICEFYNAHIDILAPIFAPATSALGGGVIVFKTNYRVDSSDSRNPESAVE